MQAEVNRQASGKTIISVRANELFYYLFFVIMVMVKGTGMYEGMKLYTFGLLLAMLCLGMKLVTDRYTVIEVIIAGLLIGLGLAIYLCSGETAALIYIGMAVGMKNIPIRRIFAVGGLAWTGCFLYRAVLAMSGIRRGMVLVHEKLGLGPLLRWSFGYPHPNVMHITYTVLAAFALYLFRPREKKMYFWLAALMLGNCLIFCYAFSFTGFLLTACLLVLYFYFEVRNKIAGIEKILILAIFPACILFAVVLPLAMEKGCFLNFMDDFMNDLFNTRFLASRVYIYEGLSLFGKDFSRSDITFALDSSYVYLLVKEGAVFFAVLVIGYEGMIIRMLKENRRTELAIVLAFLIAGISEPFLFNTSFKNITFLFLGYYLFLWLREYGDKCEIALLKRKLGVGWRNKAILTWNGASVTEWLEEMKEIWHHKRKMLWIITLFCAILGLGVYCVTLRIPDSIYVAVGNTDCGERKIYHFEQQAVAESQDALFYEYGGTETPMYRFDGNAIALEVLRDGMSSVLLGLLAGRMISVVIVAVLVQKEKGRRSENDSCLEQGK